MDDGAGRIDARSKLVAWMQTLRVRCGFCATESDQSVAGAAREIEPPDFVTRPGEHVRSTIHAWMQHCPECGYCAADISSIHEDAVPLLGTPEYHRQRSDASFPEGARPFLCHSLILQHLGQWADAGWSSLHAAWVCDDSGDVASAVACRTHALTLWQRAKKGGENFGDDLGMEYVLVTDLYRRTGQFEQAVVTCSDALDTQDLPPMLEQILRREKALIDQKDTAAHSLASILRTS